MCSTSWHAGLRSRQYAELRATCSQALISTVFEWRWLLEPQNTLCILSCGVQSVIVCVTRFQYPYVRIPAEPAPSISRIRWTVYMEAHWGVVGTVTPAPLGLLFEDESLAKYGLLGNRKSRASLSVYKLPMRLCRLFFYRLQHQSG